MLYWEWNSKSDEELIWSLCKWAVSMQSVAAEILIRPHTPPTARKTGIWLANVDQVIGKWQNSAKWWLQLWLLRLSISLICLKSSKDSLYCYENESGCQGRLCGNVRFLTMDASVLCPVGRISLSKQQLNRCVCGWSSCLGVMERTNSSTTQKERRLLCSMSLYVLFFP